MISVSNLSLTLSLKSLSVSFSLSPSPSLSLPYCLYALYVYCMSASLSHYLICTPLVFACDLDAAPAIDLGLAYDRK